MLNALDLTSRAAEQLAPFLRAHADRQPDDSGAAVVTVTASYAAELLAFIKVELGLPFPVKLMYPDPDFGEMCLMTTLAELADECSGIQLKANPSVRRTLSTSEQETTDVTLSFMANVPLLCTLSDDERFEIATHMEQMTVSTDVAIITEGDEVRCFAPRASTEVLLYCASVTWRRSKLRRARSCL